MRASNFPIFTAVSMATSANSAPVSLFNIFGYAIQLEFTGAPVGTVSVYVSCDPDFSGGQTPPAPSNWSLLANSTLSISAAGDITYNINEVNYNWFYVAYTATSGTGTLNGRCNLKGF